MGEQVKSVKPAAVIQPSISSVEKTQPFSVVRAMLTAKRAEKGGVVWSAPVIKSKT